MRAFLIATIGFVLFVGQSNCSPRSPRPQAPGTPAAATPMAGSDDEKALYALGVAVSQNLVSFDFTPAELEKVKQGFTDGALGKTAAGRSADLHPSPA